MFQLYYPIKYLLNNRASQQPPAQQSHACATSQYCHTVFPPHLVHSPAQLNSQQRRKHASFANPSTLQKCSAGKSHNTGTPSFRMVLKTVVTQLCFCLFSSSAVAGWLQRERRRGFPTQRDILGHCCPSCMKQEVQSLPQTTCKF